MVEAACPAALLSHAANRVFWRGVVSACLLITSEKSFVMAHCLLALTAPATTRCLCPFLASTSVCPSMGAG